MQGPTLQILAKLIKLIKVSISETKFKCGVGRGLSEDLAVQRRVLFNLVLEKIIRQIRLNPDSTIFNTSSQVLAHDVLLLRRRERVVADTYSQLDFAGKEVGLDVDMNKTKLILTPQILSSNRAIGSLKFH